MFAIITQYSRPTVSVYCDVLFKTGYKNFITFNNLKNKDFVDQN